MKRIGITGQGGFVGSHLYNTLGLHPDKYTRIPFERDCFSNPSALDAFVAQCDVIVHLAGVNRNPDPDALYAANVGMAEQLVESMVRTGVTPQVIFSSSTQEERDNHYGNSKKDARKALQEWAITHNGRFTGLLIPNVFGPFGKPFYNSVVATFCHQLTHGESPRVDVDATLNLIHVGELVQVILQVIDEDCSDPALTVQSTSSSSVTTILNHLILYRDLYHKQGVIPELNSPFEINLFNTFRSFEDAGTKYPVKYTQHTDNRGAFTELIRLNVGGQVSFSTTHPGITRGNHFHTRKIERFSVIAGEATIQLRKIGTDEVLNFHLSGKEPAYVDMPVWYTHNITNTGKEELYTVFWINEFFDPADPDTFFETV
jgi:UDP-2-acetamido-2,6-beta-L-arabino-hexul-4-ose reductase